MFYDRLGYVLENFWCSSVDLRVFWRSAGELQETYWRNFGEFVE